MKSFVDAGFTTVFSMGDDPKGILELRRRLRAGEIVGPTLYAAYFMLLTKGLPPPAHPVSSPYTDPGRTDPARPPDRPTTALTPLSDDEARTPCARRSRWASTP